MVNSESKSNHGGNRKTGANPPSKYPIERNALSPYLLSLIDEKGSLSAELEKILEKIPEEVPLVRKRGKRAESNQIYPSRN